LFQRYSGNPISVTVSTLPPGLTVNLTYNGLPTGPVNAGSYTVVGKISDPNYFGGITNALVVGDPPQALTASSASGNNGQQLSLQLDGTPNYPYVLQIATNLNPRVLCQSVLTNTANGSGKWNCIITNLSDAPESFYRAFAQ
jgi:hypothetical protein